MFQKREDLNLKSKILSVNINDKNEYFINGGSTPIISENIKNEILKI